MSEQQQPERDRTEQQRAAVDHTTMPLSVLLRSLTIPQIGAIIGAFAAVAGAGFFVGGQLSAVQIQNLQNELQVQRSIGDEEFAELLYRERQRAKAQLDVLWLELFRDAELVDALMMGPYVDVRDAAQSKLHKHMRPEAPPSLLVKFSGPKNGSLLSWLSQYYEANGDTKDAVSQAIESLFMGDDSRMRSARTGLAEFSKKSGFDRKAVVRTFMETLAPLVVEDLEDYHERLVLARKS